MKTTKIEMTDFLKRSFYHLYTMTKPFFPVQPTRIYSKYKGNNIGYGMNPLLTTIRNILKRFRLEENTICKSFDILVPKVISLWPLIKRSFSTQLCKKLFIPSGKNY